MTRSPDCVSSSKRFSVFDFSEEDECVEKASEKLLGKYGNPKRRNRHSSPMTKYNFLQCFAGHYQALNNQIGNEPIVIDDGPIDVDTRGSSYATGRTKTVLKEPIDLKAYGLIHIDDEPIDIDDTLIDVDHRGTETRCSGTNGLVDIDTNNLGYCYNYDPSLGFTPNQNGVVMEDTSELDILVLSSSSNYENEHVDMITDDDDRIKMAFSSTSFANLVEDEDTLEDIMVQNGSAGHKIDSLNKNVVVFAEYVMYGDICCIEPHLTFSRSCIRVEGAPLNQVRGTLNIDWTIGDIVNIESEWCRAVETAMICVHLKPKLSKGEGNANEASDVDKLKFSVYDPNWSEAEEAIKLLDVRYSGIWNITYDTYKEKDENAIMRGTCKIISRSYISVLDKTCEDVIYPDGDPDAVLISKRDAELLRPESFVNDTIIDFYIKYLKNKIQPEDQSRFHFFNSFFFRKLADIDKDPSSVCEGRAAFERLHKWTKKVNIFDKDYIFIPINYSLHWSLIVICHPGEVVNLRDDESEKSIRVPCILHMDSIKGSHKGLRNLFQRYLCEEWKERHDEKVHAESSKFMDLRFVSLELPQQENSFDCGLFLLHYVERFLEEAPIHFSPFRITNSSSFLNRNWFAPEEASLKRARVQKLIYEILEDQSEKVAPKRDSTDKQYSSPFLCTNERETGVEVFEGKCNVPETCLGDFQNPISKQDIGFSMSGLSRPEVIDLLSRELALNSRELFEPGICTRSYSCGNNKQMGACYWKRYLSPVQEAEGNCEVISDSSPDREISRQVTELATVSPTSCSRENSKSLGSGKQEDVRVDKFYRNNSSYGVSSSRTQKSSEISLDEDNLHTEFDTSCRANRTDVQIPSSTSSGDTAALVVEDSEESSSMNTDNMDYKESPTSFHGSSKNDLSPSVEESDSIGIIVIDSDEQGGKKPRLT